MTDRALTDLERVALRAGCPFLPHREAHSHERH